MSKGKKELVFFIISILLIVCIVILHGWLMQLTTYDSNTWQQYKNPVSLTTFILSVIGFVTSIVSSIVSKKRTFKYFSVLLALMYIFTALWSLWVVAVSGVGFLG